MPGAFAHMTIVYVAKNLPQLDGKNGLSDDCHRAISGLTKYAELGSVSPDYPYLSLFDEETDEWADLMHYDSTGDMIRVGAKLLRDMPSGVDKRKCLAWLMGYAAHVITDVSIHPVVKIKVGDYAENKTEHRICEMNQDAFIYNSKLNVGNITDTEHLKQGFCNCGDEDSIDPVIKKFWLKILKEVHPAVFAENAPDIDQWHRNFIKTVDGIADEGGWLPSLILRPLRNQGVLYKEEDEVDNTYIKNLNVPGGERMDYEQIFDKAAENVANVWLEISHYTDSKKDMAIVRNWNLDTGIDLASKKLTFWGNIEEEIA